tara:strand:- start:498 stop:632 length:135 start_codon:yes stop_codon:yes gene_type:complete
MALSNLDLPWGGDEEETGGAIYTCAALFNTMQLFGWIRSPTDSA